MCLAIPGKLISISNQEDELFRDGMVSFNGIEQKVNLSMTPEAVKGDYILVHVGVAISIVDEEEAKKTFEYLREMEELDDFEEPNNGP